MIRAQVFDQRVTRDDGERLLERMLRLPLQLVDSSSQFLRAFNLALRFGHRKAHDMQYLAVAELVEAEIVTLDRGIRYAAEDLGISVRFLGNSP